MLFFQAFAAIASASIRPAILPLGAWFGFGILIPIRHGMDFLDARMVMAYAFIPMLFVASPVAMGLPQARQTENRLYAWLAAAILFGWCIGFLFLTTALVTVNLEFRPTPWQLPDGDTLRSFAIFCLTTVWFICSSAAYLAMVFSPSISRQCMRIGFVLLLMLAYAGPSLLPIEAQLAMGEMDAGRTGDLIACLLSLAAAGLSYALRYGVQPQRS